MSTENARWVRVATSRDVGPDAVVDVSIGPDDYVVWRSASGRPCVMEARCPHQWSHLGAEGVVAGDEIVCLTHLWRFDTDGCGWLVNVKGRRDRKGDIAVFECREADGHISARLPEPSDQA